MIGSAEFRRLHVGLCLAILITPVVSAPPAFAQQDTLPPATDVPPPPPIAAAPAVPPPAPDIVPPQKSVNIPRYLPTQPPGAASTPSATTPATPQSDTAPNQQPLPETMPQPQESWVNRPVAVLAALDQEDGLVSSVTAPVGSSFTKGKMHVTVKACVTHPPSEIPDAAIYLIVTESDGTDQQTPLFRGWLIRSEPGAAVVADSSLTFRVIGCLSAPPAK